MYCPIRKYTWKFSFDPLVSKTKANTHLGHAQCGNFVGGFVKPTSLGCMQNLGGLKRENLCKRESKRKVVSILQAVQKLEYVPAIEKRWSQLVLIDMSKFKRLKKSVFFTPRYGNVVDSFFYQMNKTWGSLSVMLASVHLSHVQVTIVIIMLSTRYILVGILIFWMWNHKLILGGKQYKWPLAQVYFYF